MAQQMITLDEAAIRLGISPEEMKKRLKTDPEFKKLSQIRDGSTLRFKLSAIDELARQFGQTSEPEMPPIQIEQPLLDSDEFEVNINGKKKPKKDEDQPLDFGSTEEDVFSLAEEDLKPAPGQSSGRIAVGKPDSSSKILKNKPESSGKIIQNKLDSSGKLSPAKAESSGRLIPNMPESSTKMNQRKQSKPLSEEMSDSSDGSVRLDGDKPRKRKNKDVPTPAEDIAIDFSPPGSASIKGGSSAKLSAPRSSDKLGPGSGKSKAPQKPFDEQESSEFELSLDADSDNFDLETSPTDGDSVELGEVPQDKPGGSGLARGGASGINLRSPSDTGISLEKDKPKSSNKLKAQDDDSTDYDEREYTNSEFELSLDSSEAEPDSNLKLNAPKSGSKFVLDTTNDPTADSEFELQLNDSGDSLEVAALGDDVLDESAENKGDIFETDFEIPPMEDESASEAVALESDTDIEGSDIDIDVESAEESGSEVVLLDDEDDGSPKSKRGKSKRKLGDDESEPDVDLDVELTDDEDDASVSKALRGAKGRAQDDEDEDDEPVMAGVAAPTKPWGIVPVLFLAPSLLFVLVGAIMGYELLQTMWGYQQPRKPTAPLVRAIASQLDMELKDQ